METPLTTRLSAVMLAVFASPVIVTLPVSPLMLILDPAAILVTMPVKSAPLTAGNVVGNLPAGIVPTLRLDADTLPSKLVAVITPVEFICPDSTDPNVLTPDTTKLSADIVAVFAKPVMVTSPVPPLMLILDPAAILVTIPVRSVPLNAGKAPLKLDEDNVPSKLVAVIIPLLASRVIAVPTFTTFVNVAAVPVMILSVDATPVRPDPSPTKLAAVMIPDVLTLPVVPIPVDGRFVKLAPLIEGNAAGNLASGIVPEPRFVAFKPVKLLPSKAGSAPLRFDDANVPSKLVAVITPLRFKSPVPDINFPFKSRFPPNLGVVSSKILVMLTSEALIVTIPADRGVTERFVPKLIVAATPTKDPSSLILIPELSAVTPVSPAPSPLKDDAVIIPLATI